LADCSFVGEVVVILWREQREIRVPPTHDGFRGSVLRLWVGPVSAVLYECFSQWRLPLLHDCLSHWMSDTTECFSQWRPLKWVFVSITMANSCRVCKCPSFVPFQLERFGLSGRFHAHFTGSRVCTRATAAVTGAGRCRNSQHSQLTPSNTSARPTTTHYKERETGKGGELAWARCFTVTGGLC
jgi:hypothetical protein